MYALKILSGKLKGEVLPLQGAQVTIGRSPNCDVTLPNSNISKAHAKIVFESNRILITDLNSTNGSFVNGIKIETSILNPGDKIALFDTILEFVNAEGEGQGKILQFPFADQISSTEEGQEPEDPGTYSEPQHFSTPVDKFLWMVNRYIDRAAMPPILKAAEFVEFKWLVGLFCIGLVLMTVLLSTFPLMSIINDSIEMESKRRALSLAKLLATVNRDALMKKNFSGVSVDLGQREPGVQRAMIIRQSDGSIIAPSYLSGKFSQDPFIQTARKATGRPYHVRRTERNKIIALFPIKYYSSQEGIDDITHYYSVVIYNSKVLATDDNRTLSLLVQTLLLALVFGLILYVLFLKLVEFPIRKLNMDIKQALFSDNKSLSTKVLFPALNEVYSNVSSALSRESGNETSQAIEADRTMEMQNIVELIGYPSIAIIGESETISDYNAAFEEITSLHDINGLPLKDLTDQALRQNLEDLILRLQEDSDSTVANEFEFGGIPFEIRMHTIKGTEGVAYYIAAFIPMEVE